MENTAQNKPRATGQSGRGAGTFENRQGNHNKKLPPYGTLLNPQLKEIAVLTGSHSWAMACLPHWRPAGTLVLPFGENPTAFKWPVSGKAVVVLGFGEAESRERLLALSVELIVSRATVVCWRGQFVIDDDGEPRLLKGDLSDHFSPVFKKRDAA